MTFLVTWFENNAYQDTSKIRGRNSTMACGLASIFAILIGPHILNLCYICD